MDEIPSKRRPAAVKRQEAYAQSFARGLDAAIKESDLSAEDVAYLTGIHVTSISTYRRGVREPGIGKAAVLAEVLGVPLGELLRDPEASPASASPGGELGGLGDETARDRKAGRRSSRRKRASE